MNTQRQSLGKRNYNQFQFGIDSNTTLQNQSKKPSDVMFNTTFNYLDYSNYKYPINTAMALEISRCDANTLPYIQNFQSESEYFKACKEFIAYHLWNNYIGNVDIIILKPIKEYDPISQSNKITAFKVIIYFNEWYNNETTYWMQQELIIDNTYQYNIYRDWYWNFTIYYKSLTCHSHTNASFRCGHLPILQLKRK